MIFFKKKDPICGMKEEKGKGIKDDKSGNWFCSNECIEKYDKTKVKTTGCCG